MILMVHLDISIPRKERLFRLKVLMDLLVPESSDEIIVKVFLSLVNIAAYQDYRQCISREHVRRIVEVIGDRSATSDSVLALGIWCLRNLVLNDGFLYMLIEEEAVLPKLLSWISKYEDNRELQEQASTLIYYLSRPCEYI